MKLALIALVLSSSTFAADCFVRNQESVTREVSVAREICVESINLKLDYFATSIAQVNITTDGVSAQRIVKLQNGSTLPTGEKAFKLVLESREVGGGCDNTWSAQTKGTLLVANDGSAARVSDVSAEINFSYDNCHSGFSTKEKFTYAQR